ncbi:MAG: T9SS type A sorting domain-containing protein [Candidatus Krumholzibacteria bacterium]|nr:T9SS type A sorting domain-containing protein [Candidatus Krumholzibacteria bacterium]
MARFRLLAIVSLLACCIAAPLAAQISAGGGDRQMLRIDPDPNSTFEIGELTNVFLKDTVSVPLYLHTTASVGYIECRFTWTGSDLVLLSATMGPGVPDTASFTPTSMGGSTERIVISNPEEFTIASGQPIAYLNFEVQCFGWGAMTYISFVNDDYYSFYVSNNIPKSPLRNNGSVASDYEQFLVIVGSTAIVYPGEQHVSWTYDLYQEIPGKLLNARVKFNSSVLHYDSITACPELLGGTVSAVAVNDTVIVTFSPSNPFLPADVESSLFTLHFSLLNGNDDFTTTFDLLHADRIDRCGTISHPDDWFGGWIRVLNHTMTADLGESTAYPSATSYDVTFTMGSNCPINDYRFFVQFPATQIAFNGVVAVGGYTVPTAALDGSDTTIVQINASLNTNYLPSDLPATVFKLRFTPRSTPQTVGTVFPITFYATPLNKGKYLMDGSFGYHEADLTLLDGSITIVSVPNPGGCPTLYVWNGSSFAKDNTILAASDGAKAPVEATDFYMVSKPVAASNGELRFQIREDGKQVSEFREFKLMIADHPASKPVQVTKDGTIITIGQPYAILWAKDSRGNDITGLIAAHDDVLYSSDESGYFDVSFGKLTKEQIGSIALGASSKPKEPRDLLRGEPGEDPHMKDKKLKVSVRTASGGWELISVEDARLEPSRVATMIDPKLIDPSCELVVRYSWEDSYQLDVLEFNSVEPFKGRLTEPRLVSASRMTLSPGEAIDLVFDASSLPPTSTKMERSYIFVATGKYETPGETPALPTVFALEANSPNPFNPSTVIHYSLPIASRVEIRVFDVRGALVRTLVSAFQTAGRKSVTWNGLADSGSRVASGVYFCKMTSTGFEKTRKMILVR